MDVVGDGEVDILGGHQYVTRSTLGPNLINGGGRLYYGRSRLSSSGS